MSVLWSWTSADQISTNPLYYPLLFNWKSRFNAELSIHSWYVCDQALHQKIQPWIWTMFCVSRRRVLASARTCVCDRACLCSSHALARCSFPLRNQPLSELLNHTRSQPLRRKLITFLPPPPPPLIFSTLAHTHSISFSFLTLSPSQSLFSSLQPGISFAKGDRFF